MEIYSEAINGVFFSIPSKAVLSIVLGISLMIFHSLNFKFLINKSTIYLSLMLPVTVLFITQAIATNLYLSLGLIGALSIVRYRTPVKSIYELAYLFALIAIGVISGLILCIIPLLFMVIAKYFPFLNSEDLRFNSDKKIEMSMTLKIEDLSKINYEKHKARLIRIDSNYKAKESFVTLNFNTLSDANEFKDNLKIIPTTLSITNS